MEAINKNDWILIVFISFCIVFLSIYMYMPKNNLQKEVRITLDGKEYKALPIDKNEKVLIDKGDLHCVVQIENGEVKISSSSCSDNLCVKQGSIKNSGQSIVCLPNKISVQVVSKKSEIDTITH